METLCSDPVLVLPIELLVRQIFQWLKIMDVCTCRLVSTRWNRIASLNINNRKEFNFAHVPIVSEFGLNSILKITRHLRVVRLDECTKCTNEENLILLAENCPGLRVLTTSRCKWVTDNAIKVLCELCTELQELDFSSCYQISDEGISYVSQCKNLRELCVSSCYGVTDKSIQKVTEHCSKLKELDVSWCPLVSDAGLKPLLKNCQVQLLRIKCCKRCLDYVHPQKTSGSTAFYGSSGNLDLFWVKHFDENRRTAKQKVVLELKFISAQSWI